MSNIAFDLNYTPQLQNYLRDLIGSLKVSENDIDDVLQKSLLIMSHKFYLDGTEFRKVLTGIVKLECKKHLRDSGRFYRDLVSFDDLHSKGFDVIDTDDTFIIKGHLTSDINLDILTRKEVRYLYDRYWLNKSVKQMAKDRNVQHQSIYHYLNKILFKLRKEMSK